MLVSVILFVLYRLFYVFASMNWMCSFEMIRGQFNKKITSVVYSVAIVFNSENNSYTCKSVFKLTPGSVIQDHWLDHVASNEPMNPLWTRIHRFIWSTMIQVISDHWSISGSSQTNAPIYDLCSLCNKVSETVRQKTFASLNTTQAEWTTLMQ